jgi:hypothetical protein
MSGLARFIDASRAGLRRPHSVVTEIIGPTIKVERDRIADRLKGVTSSPGTHQERHRIGTRYLRAGPSSSLVA